MTTKCEILLETAFVETCAFNTFSCQRFNIYMDKSQSNLHRRCYIYTTACVWWSKERVESHIACMLIHYVHIHTHTHTHTHTHSDWTAESNLQREVHRSMHKKRNWNTMRKCLFSSVFYEIQYCFCDITTYHMSPVPAFNIIAMHKCPQIPVELFQNSRHFKGF